MGGINIVREMLRGLGLTAALVLTLAGPAVAQRAVSAPAFVTINSGSLRGAATADVISFKGIPYAAPPVGALRWRAPQPVSPWQDVRAAAQFGPRCMQPDDVPKSEDCLTLNVWRPAAASAIPLPVMVWIYGGGLLNGTSACPAEPLARQGIIVVSMNYRLGRLGFFVHPAQLAETPDELQGNYGYLDQIAALQWVQHNIKAFGGDPSAVTIFGESAGGGSVIVHLTSPLSRGLFQRAIMQSPALPSSRAKITPLTELSTAEEMGVEYARSVGVAGNGPAALDALRGLSADKLIEGSASGIGVAGAIHDGKLVVETPEAALAAGRQAKVPVIIAANDRDMRIGDADSRDALFAIFGPNANEARQLYDAHGDQTLDEMKQQVFVDKTMFEPVRHLADEMVRAGQSAWVYRFSYVPESERAKVTGALHAREISFTFGDPAGQVGNEVTAADEMMGEVVSGYWVSFGKSGDPNGSGRPKWLRHDLAVGSMINFTNAGAVVGPDPLNARLDLWQKLWSSAP